MGKNKKELKVTVKDLLEAGCHFGHQKRRWNPKMERFIFGIRGGLYIIDLAKTMEQLRKACDVVAEVASQGKPILFVGTKKQAKDVIKKCAENCNEYYVCQRWLGGMLTNMQTIRNSVKTLDQIEKTLSSGGEGLTKKELSLLTKEQEKLDRNLSGIRSLRKLPGLLIIVDPSNEHIAVAEAKKLNIPIMALIDTNCNPDPIDHPIPGNDDALKSIRLIIEELTEVIKVSKESSNRGRAEKLNLEEKKEAFS